MIGARGLFAQEIERRADLDPPLELGMKKEYYIVVMGYWGGKVGVHWEYVGYLLQKYWWIDPPAYTIEEKALNTKMLLLWFRRC
jgi:hypothetical protein